MGPKDSKKKDPNHLIPGQQKLTQMTFSTGGKNENALLLQAGMKIRAEENKKAAKEAAAEQARQALAAEAKRKRDRREELRRARDDADAENDDSSGDDDAEDGGEGNNNNNNNNTNGDNANNPPPQAPQVAKRGRAKLPVDQTQSNIESKLAKELADEVQPNKTIHPFKSWQFGPTRAFVNTIREMKEHNVLPAFTQMLQRFEIMLQNGQALQAILAWWNAEHEPTKAAGICPRNSQMIAVFRAVVNQLTTSNVVTAAAAARFEFFYKSSTIINLSTALKILRHSAVTDDERPSCLVLNPHPYFAQNRTVKITHEKGVELETPIERKTDVAKEALLKGSPLTVDELESLRTLTTRIFGDDSVIPGMWKQCKPEENAATRITSQPSYYSKKALQQSINQGDANSNKKDGSAKKRQDAGPIPPPAPGPPSSASLTKQLDFFSGGSNNNNYDTNNDNNMMMMPRGHNFEDGAENPILRQILQNQKDDKRDAQARFLSFLLKDAKMIARMNLGREPTDDEVQQVLRSREFTCDVPMSDAALLVQAESLDALRGSIGAYAGDLCELVGDGLDDESDELGF